MDIQPIKNALSHAAALAEIEVLMRAKRDTPEGDRLDVLVTLVQAYEAKHQPIDPPAVNTGGGGTANRPPARAGRRT